MEEETADSPAWRRIQPHLFDLTSLSMQQYCLMFIIDTSLCMPLKSSSVSAFVREYAADI
jgi:hypothetical protein